MGISFCIVVPLLSGSYYRKECVVILSPVVSARNSIPSASCIAHAKVFQVHEAMCWLAVVYLIGWGSAPAAKRRCAECTCNSSKRSREST